MAIKIQQCQLEDFDGVIALLRQLWPGMALDAVALRGIYERALDSDQSHYLCAVGEGRIVGFGSLAVRNTLRSGALIGFVDELIVDEAHRGSGRGTRILDSLISRARERGCDRVELDSAFHRKEAHVFYERRGFQSRAYLFSKAL